MDSVPAYVAAARGDGLQPDSESDRAALSPNVLQNQGSSPKYGKCTLFPASSVFPRTGLGWAGRSSKMIGR